MTVPCGFAGKENHRGNRFCDDKGVWNHTVKEVTIYTDGGSLGNPGKGGYAAILVYGGHQREISGGYRLTTNNRMEMMACIRALESLRYPCRVTLYSDSRYLVDGVMKGWAERWRRNNWMRNKKDRAENPDLWEKLLNLLKQHDVKLVWIKGHSGHPENERCDILVKKEAAREDLPADDFYEKMESVE